MQLKLLHPKDLNINNCANNKSPDAMHFLNTLISCRSFLTITKPTRVTDSTATIIDLTITNVTTDEILQGVIETFKVSDHYTVFCQVYNIIPFPPKKNDNFIDYYRDNLNLIPIYSTMIYIVFWILILRNYPK